MYYVKPSYIGFINENLSFQDNNGTIENEELRGFLKDLLELVKKVSLNTLRCQPVSNT